MHELLLNAIDEEIKIATDLQRFVSASSALTFGSKRSFEKHSSANNNNLTENFAAGEGRDMDSTETREVFMIRDEIAKHIFGTDEFLSNELLHEGFVIDIWDSVQKWFNNLVDKIKSWFRVLVDAVREIIGVFKVISQPVLRILRDVFSPLLNGAFGDFVRYFIHILQFMVQSLGTVLQFIADMLTMVIEMLLTLVEFIKKLLSIMGGYLSLELWKDFSQEVIARIIIGLVYFVLIRLAILYVVETPLMGPSQKYDADADLTANSALSELFNYFKK